MKKNNKISGILAIVLTSGTLFALPYMFEQSKTEARNVQSQESGVNKSKTTKQEKAGSYTEADINVKSTFVGGKDTGQIIDIDGVEHLFLWGDNASGNLGIRFDETDPTYGALASSIISAPEDINLDGGSFGLQGSVKEVAMTQQTTFVAYQATGEEEIKIFSMGSNQCGLLGRGLGTGDSNQGIDPSEQFVPGQVHFYEKDGTTEVFIKELYSISTSTESVFVSFRDTNDNARVYSWGRNNLGNLGQGISSANSTSGDWGWTAPVEDWSGDAAVNHPVEITDNIWVPVYDADGHTIPDETFLSEQQWYYKKDATAAVGDDWINGGNEMLQAEGKPYLPFQTQKLSESNFVVSYVSPTTRANYFMLEEKGVSDPKHAIALCGYTDWGRNPIWMPSQTSMPVPLVVFWDGMEQYMADYGDGNQMFFNEGYSDIDRIEIKQMVGNDSVYTILFEFTKDGEVTQHLFTGGQDTNAFAGEKPGNAAGVSGAKGMTGGVITNADGNENYTIVENAIGNVDDTNKTVYLNSGDEIVGLYGNGATTNVLIKTVNPAGGYYYSIVSWGENFYGNINGISYDGTTDPGDISTPTISFTTMPSTAAADFAYPLLLESTDAGRFVDNWANQDFDLDGTDDISYDASKYYEITNVSTASKHTAIDVDIYSAFGGTLEDSRTFIFGDNRSKQINNSDNDFITEPLALLTSATPQQDGFGIKTESITSDSVDIYFNTYSGGIFETFDPSKGLAYTDIATTDGSAAIEATAGENPNLVIYGIDSRNESGDVQELKDMTLSANDSSKDIDLQYIGSGTEVATDSAHDETNWSAYYDMDTESLLNEQKNSTISERYNYRIRNLQASTLINDLSLSINEHHPVNVDGKIATTLHAKFSAEDTVVTKQQTDYIDIKTSFLSGTSGYENVTYDSTTHNDLSDEEFLNRTAVELLGEDGTPYIATTSTPNEKLNSTFGLTATSGVNLNLVSKEAYDSSWSTGVTNSDGEIVPRGAETVLRISGLKENTNYIGANLYFVDDKTNDKDAVSATFNFNTINKVELPEVMTVDEATITKDSFEYSLKINQGDITDSTTGEVTQYQAADVNALKVTATETYYDGTVTNDVALTNTLVSGENGQYTYKATGLEGYTTYSNFKFEIAESDSTISGIHVQSVATLNDTTNTVSTISTPYSINSVSFAETFNDGSQDVDMVDNTKIGISIDVQDQLDNHELTTFDPETGLTSITYDSDKKGSDQVATFNYVGSDNGVIDATSKFYYEITGLSNYEEISNIRVVTENSATSTLTGSTHAEKGKLGLTNVSEFSNTTETTTDLTIHTEASSIELESFIPENALFKFKLTEADGTANDYTEKAGEAGGHITYVASDSTDAYRYTFANLNAKTTVSDVEVSYESELYGTITSGLLTSTTTTNSKEADVVDSNYTVLTTTTDETGSTLTIDGISIIDINNDPSYTAVETIEVKMTQTNNIDKSTDDIDVIYNYSDLTTTTPGDSTTPTIYSLVIVDLEANSTYGNISITLDNGDAATMTGTATTASKTFASDLTTTIDSTNDAGTVDTSSAKITLDSGLGSDYIYTEQLITDGFKLIDSSDASADKTGNYISVSEVRNSQTISLDASVKASIGKYEDGKVSIELTGLHANATYTVDEVALSTDGTDTDATSDIIKANPSSVIDISILTWAIDNFKLDKNTFEQDQIDYIESGFNISTSELSWGAEYDNIDPTLVTGFVINGQEVSATSNYVDDASIDEAVEGISGVVIDYSIDMTSEEAQNMIGDEIEITSISYNGINYDLASSTKLSTTKLWSSKVAVINGSNIDTIKTPEDKLTLEVGAQSDEDTLTYTDPRWEEINSIYINFNGNGKDYVLSQSTTRASDMTFVVEGLTLQAKTDYEITFNGVTQTFTTGEFSEDPIVIPPVTPEEPSSGFKLWWIAVILIPLLLIIIIIILALPKKWSVKEVTEKEKGKVTFVTNKKEKLLSQIEGKTLSSTENENLKWTSSINEKGLITISITGLKKEEQLTNLKFVSEDSKDIKVSGKVELN